MNQLVKQLFLSLLGFWVCTVVSAQIVLVNNGKSKSRIVLTKETPVNRTAANILQMFVQKISGKNLPITLGQQALGKGDIWIDGELSSGVS